MRKINILLPGILLPLEPAEFPPFDWVGHIEKHGGEAAPLECFWKVC